MCAKFGADRSSRFTVMMRHTYKQRLQPYTFRLSTFRDSGVESECEPFSILKQILLIKSHLKILKEELLSSCLRIILRQFFFNNTNVFDLTRYFNVNELIKVIYHGHTRGGGGGGGFL